MRSELNEIAASDDAAAQELEALAACMPEWKDLTDTQRSKVLDALREVNDVAAQFKQSELAAQRRAVRAGMLWLAYFGEVPSPSKATQRQLDEFIERFPDVPNPSDLNYIEELFGSWGEYMEALAARCADGVGVANAALREEEENAAPTPRGGAMSAKIAQERSRELMALAGVSGRRIRRRCMRRSWRVRSTGG